MKLKEWREIYPEYEDYEDDEVMSEFDVEPDEEEPDTVTPALYDIQGMLEKLCTSVQEIVIPDKSADVLLLLKQIKNGLGSLEVAIKAIDVNVNLPAPIVNIPKQESIKIPEIIMPEPCKEWLFDIKRDRNGFIQSVTARA